MESWHLPSVEASGKREPRVLFSSPECRAVLLDLEAGDEMGEHQVRERAVLELVYGRVVLAAAGGELECAPGTLVTFAPGERHSVRALEHSRLLLMLSPWRGEGHYPG